MAKWMIMRRPDQVPTAYDYCYWILIPYIEWSDFRKNLVTFIHNLLWCMYDIPLETRHEPRFGWGIYRLWQVTAWKKQSTVYAHCSQNFTSYFNENAFCWGLVEQGFWLLLVRLSKQRLTRQLQRLGKDSARWSVTLIGMGISNLSGPSYRAFSTPVEKLLASAAAVHVPPASLNWLYIITKHVRPWPSSD